MIEGKGEGVFQHGGSLLEADPVLPQIGLCFFRIPLDLQAHPGNLSTRAPTGHQRPPRTQVSQPPPYPLRYRSAAITFDRPAS
jgi:hypothetical protein